ncbi:MAG: GNAT family N-acetyltransferase [Phocaeicola sp.]
MHSQPTVTTLEAAKELWNLCFQDDEQFTSFYFRCRYSDEIHRAIYRKGVMIAALQAIPYQLNWRGRLIETAYISGACTHPDYRKQGVMRQLLEEAHLQMYRDGVGISTLIPADSWLFNYYAESGYETLFSYQTKRVFTSSLRKLSTIKVEKSKKLSTGQFLFVNNLMKLRNCSLLHSEKDLEAVVEAFSMEGGVVLVATANESICGMAFVVMQNGIVIIKELLTGGVDTLSTEYSNLSVRNEKSSSPERDALLIAASEHFQVDELVCYQPPLWSEKGMIRANEDNISSLGMARIINVPQVLQCWAEIYPEATDYIHLEGDEAIPENNGYYVIHAGTLEVVQLADVSYETHTLTTLTQKLFLSEVPYMSLMLD